MQADRKPKIWQQYLGKADDIVAPADVLEPEHAVVTDFGAVAALYDLAELELVEHIDAHVPKRGNGPSVGMICWSRC